jgi:hypothetical protein
MKDAEKFANWYGQLDEKHLTILKYLFVLINPFGGSIDQISLESIELIGKQLKLYGIRALSKAQSLKAFFKLYELGLIDIYPRPPILSTSRARLTFNGYIFVHNSQYFDFQRVPQEMLEKMTYCNIEKPKNNEKDHMSMLYLHDHYLKTVN